MWNEQLSLYNDDCNDDHDADNDESNDNGMRVEMIVMVMRTNVMKLCIMIIIVTVIAS